MSARGIRVLMSLVFVLLAGGSLSAQTFRGTILGTVTDARQFQFRHPAALQLEPWLRVAQAWRGAREVERCVGDRQRRYAAGWTTF